MRIAAGCLLALGIPFVSLGCGADDTSGEVPLVANPNGGKSGAAGAGTAGNGGSDGGSGGQATGGSNSGGQGGSAAGQSGSSGSSGGGTAGASGSAGVAGSTPCSHSSDCDDNNPCTDDFCGAGDCYHSEIDVDDNDVCTNDICDLVAGIIHSPVDIDDSDPCTVDACDPMTGPSHEPVELTDGNPCTVDWCDPVAGLQHLPEAVLLSEGFTDHNPGWVLGDEWQIGPAFLSAGGTFGSDPSIDHSGTADNGVAGVAIGENISKTPHWFSYLESPEFDGSAKGGFLELRFYRWLNSDIAANMTHVVEVYDGTTWNTLWTTEGTNMIIQDSPPAGNGWLAMSFDLTPYASEHMKVRWGFNVLNPNVATVGGLSIDDVKIVRAPVPTDNDQCTTVTCSTQTGAVYSPLNIDDGNVCTTDTCDTNFGVKHQPIAGCTP